MDDVCDQIVKLVPHFSGLDLDKSYKKDGTLRYRLEIFVVDECGISDYYPAFGWGKTPNEALKDLLQSVLEYKIAKAEQL